MICLGDLMSEWLKPKNILAFGVIGSVALFGVDRFIDYESKQAGRNAGREARNQIEQTNIADEQWARLQELLADEDLKALLVQNLQDDGIENPMDIIEAMNDGTP